MKIKIFRLDFQIGLVFSERLGLELAIQKGERIRLSEDVVKSHYKAESYMASLANSCGLSVRGNWTEDTGLLSAMVLEYQKSQS